MPMPHAAGWVPATSSVAVLRAEVLMSVSFGRGLGFALSVLDAYFTPAPLGL
jgi:hypothetical protein